MITIAEGQSSPDRVGEQRVLAPVCCVAVMVRMVVVSMLLCVVPGCGEWVRQRVDGGVRRLYVSGGQWESGIVDRPGEKEAL